jgi:hypothetical protein
VQWAKLPITHGQGEYAVAKGTGGLEQPIRFWLEFFTMLQIGIAGSDNPCKFKNLAPELAVSALRI